MPASRLPSHASLDIRAALSLPSYAPAIRGCATPLRISATLCRCAAERNRAFALTRIASRCVAIAMHCLGSQGLSVAYSAVLCFPLALSRGATPSRDIAFQSRRAANLGGALPSPCLASLCFALPSPGPAPQSNAFAARISPSPLHAAALLRHNGAMRHLAIAARCVTRPVPSPFVACPSLAVPRLCVSVRCRSFAGPCVSLPLLRRSKLCCALPSPLFSKLRLSFAERGSAVHFRRVAGQSKSLPSQLSA